jgi:Tol biopolymer transport system component
MVSGDIAGGATRSYTPTSTFSAAPAWLPDGSGFLVDIYSDSGTSVYQYNVSGGLAGAVAHANSSNADTLP